MLLARAYGQRVRAEPGLVAYCPLCDEPVIPKCGEIVTWHFAHRAHGDCDAWGEESAWHIEWKLHAPEAQREVIFERDGVRHRADLVTSTGSVVEFQHSSISGLEIAARENFYGDMCWVFDCHEAYENDRLWFTEPRYKRCSKCREYCVIKGREEYGGGWVCWRKLGGCGARFRDYNPDIEPQGHATFRWTHSRRTIELCNRPVFLDLGREADEDGRLVRVERLDEGWGVGRRVSFEDFVARIGVWEPQQLALA